MITALFAAIVWVGDSLSAADCSPPMQMAQHGQAIHADVMPGRTLLHWEPQHDLYPWPGTKDMVIWLGSNDVLQGITVNGWWINRVKVKIKAIQARGWNVIIVLPPTPVWAQNRQEWEAARDVLRGTSAHVYDPQPWWHTISLKDPLHPDCDGHSVATLHMTWALLPHLEGK